MSELSQQHETTAKRGRDWRKAMSDHVAYALLVYTALQIRPGSIDFRCGGT